MDRTGSSAPTAPVSGLQASSSLIIMCETTYLAYTLTLFYYQAGKLRPHLCCVKQRIYPPTLTLFHHHVLTYNV